MDQNADGYLARQFPGPADDIILGFAIQVRDELGEVIHDLSFRDAVKISG